MERIDRVRFTVEANGCGGILMMHCIQIEMDGHMLISYLGL